MSFDHKIIVPQDQPAAHTSEGPWDPAGTFPPGYGNRGFSSPSLASPEVGHQVAYTARIGIHRAIDRYRGRYYRYEISDAITAIQIDLAKQGIWTVSEAVYLQRVRQVVGVTNYSMNDQCGSVQWSWAVPDGY